MTKKVETGIEDALFTQFLRALGFYKFADKLCANYRKRYYGTKK
ncbi:hypothetical protein N9948_00720 [bacterium]|nr:hypothetical protein [bacterium]